MNTDLVVDCSNIFSDFDQCVEPILNLGKDAPALTGVINIGDTRSGTESVSFPVTAGTRLLMVYSITATGSLVTAVTGFASAGVMINGAVF